MLVYRDAVEPAAARARLDGIRGAAAAMAGGGGGAAPDHDAITGLLIDAGQLEAGVLDALGPEEDALPPLARALRRASLAAGRLFAASADGRGAAAVRETAGALAAELEAVGRHDLPAGALPFRVPEGTAFYGLYPESYLEAARRARLPGRPPGPALVLGLRGIGTGLSAVVAAGLEGRGWAVESAAIRPRGHPFDRRPRLAPDLLALVRAAAARGAPALVVDEGPGLSGSSFAGTAALLLGHGVAPGSVLLVPSHLPDPSGFGSPLARELWPRLAKAAATGLPARAAAPPGAIDLSGGAWRPLLYGPGPRRWPATQPGHERRKFLLPAGAGAEGRAELRKFVGLGRHGRRALARAEALAAAGFGPPPLSWGAGLLATPFLEGARPAARGRAGPALLATAARYLGFLARHFGTGGAADPAPLLEMVRVNAAEGLGPWGARLAAGLDGAAGGGAAEAVALDGRMLPQDWLRAGPRGPWLKLDATDHGLDHFHPGGAADLAWDAAAFAVELGLAPAAEARFAAAVAREAGDRHLPRRLPFHRAAWLAFRLGYTAMAAEALAGTDDGARMAASRRRYARLLGPALRAAAGGPA